MEESFKYHIPEDIPANERTAFHGAAAAAAKAGKKNFNFGGKTHPVTMKKDTAKAIADAERLIRRQAAGAWVSAIKQHGFELGDAVELHDQSLLEGNEGITLDSAGNRLFVAKLAASQTGAQYKTAKMAAQGDARVLPVQYDAQGVRHRQWRDVVAALQQITFTDWEQTLPGPRTVMWCVQLYHAFVM